MRRRAFSTLFRDLGEGDPVAWSIVGGIVLLLAVFGLVGFFIRRKMKRDDEEQKNRYG